MRYQQKRFGNTFFNVDVVNLIAVDVAESGNVSIGPTTLKKGAGSNPAIHCILYFGYTINQAGYVYGWHL